MAFGAGWSGHTLAAAAVLPALCLLISSGRRTPHDHLGTFILWAVGVSVSLHAMLFAAALRDPIWSWGRSVRGESSGRC